MSWKYNFDQSPKKAAVEEGLRLLVRTRTQERKLRALRGKLRWEGSLDDMRRDR